MTPARKSIPVRFKNPQGDTLAGILDLPGDETPSAYGVFASCFTCTKDSLATARISRTLAEKGVAVLRFDHAGLGESGGDFFNTTASVRLGDIQAAARFLEENYKAPAFFAGHSIGGTLAWHAAQKTPGLRLAASIGSPRDTRWLAQKFLSNGQVLFRDDHIELIIGGKRTKFEKGFLDDLRSIDIDAAMHLFTGKALVFHAPNDDIVSFDNAEAIFERLPGDKKLIRLPPQSSHMLENPKDTGLVAERIAGALAT